jgi:hypothetical protein
MTTQTCSEETGLCETQTCSESSDCGSGLFCVDELCEVCSSTKTGPNQCESPESCNSETGVCEEIICTGPDFCSTTGYCNDLT